MNKKVSVVIRTKNQAINLEFLLNNLRTRYQDDVDEIVVIDNESSDQSQEIGERFGVKWVTISDFGYGKSANLAAKSASNEIIVIFSAHSFPVSHDFFKVIKDRFERNANLAGVRCVHTARDFKHLIQKTPPKSQPNDAGLLFAGSAFSKIVWEKHPFQDNIVTFEDKEWTVRVLKHGYDIEMVPAIFCYDLKRSPAEFYFRFKNETRGNFKLWGSKITLLDWGKKISYEQLGLCKEFILETYYLIKSSFFLLGFILFTQTKKK